MDIPMLSIQTSSISIFLVKLNKDKCNLLRDHDF